GGGGGVGGADLHAAHRVDGVPPSAAEAVAVAVQPPEDGEHGEEHDVEERRVVPLEAGGDDLLRAVGGDGAGGGEEPLGDEPGGGHDGVEAAEEPQGQTVPVVLAVDEHQGQGDEVGEDED